MESPRLQAANAHPPKVADKPVDEGQAPTGRGGRGAERGSMESNEKIRKYVSAMMKRENMSGDKLSKLSGVSSASIYKFLNGEKNISLYGADKLLSVFGLEIKIGKVSG